MSEMKTCTKCETYASTSRKKRSGLHEDSQRKKLRFCDSSTAKYRFINKMELMKRLNNAQEEKQKSSKETSKEQHCTLRCIVENAELEFDENNSTVAIMATTKSINFKYQVSVSHFQLLTSK